jgi:predicted aldo/keto reductase-like oxidoreductase
MRLPTRVKSDWTSVIYKRGVPLLRAAMKAGVNFLDTHHNYQGGKSEIAIGKALQQWRTDIPVCRRKGKRPIIIQTKTPFYREEKQEYFERRLDEALEKLGVDRIDYLLFHSMNMGMWKKRGKAFVRFTDKALKRGLIAHRGFSSHDNPENVKKFVDTGEFSAMLLSYNWMNRREQEALAYGASKGLGVSVMNPLGGGTLATSTKQIMRLLPGAKTAAEIALRFVLATPGVDLALSGMNSHAQLAENLAVASRKTPVTAKQWKRFNERLDDVDAKAAEYCTACGYCMPCPHGVDIPSNFRLLNQVRFFGRIDWAKAQFKRLKAHRDGDKSALVCKECGRCLDKCPNDVEIINQLQEVAATLG